MAWGVLGGLLLAGAVALSQTSHAEVAEWGRIVAWLVAPFVGAGILIFALVDPLLHRRDAATPSFARDLIALGLYVLAAGVVLRQVAGVSLQALLGTGAIVAAVLGLSLQETLGNLFAGVSLHISPCFRVGDWIEVSGKAVMGAATLIASGRVEATTWRCVLIRDENGNLESVPNLLVAQSVVTNLFEAPRLHRGTGRVVVEPTQNLHVAIEKLGVALAGIPHLPARPPEVVVADSQAGGAVLEMRWWVSGFRSSRAAQQTAFRLAATCLSREGFPLLGPAGPSSPHPKPHPLDVGKIHGILQRMGLPQEYAEGLHGRLTIRRAAPGEGIIRDGDPGDSLFWVLSGKLAEVKAVQPGPGDGENGIEWGTIADMGPGEWFGEASLLTGAPRRATVVASTACDLVEITRDAFEEILRGDPQVLEVLVDFMERHSPAPDAGHHRDTRRNHWLSAIRAWFRVE